MNSKDAVQHSIENQESGLLDPENLEPLIRETKKLEQPIEQLLQHEPPPLPDFEQIERRIDTLHAAVNEIRETSQSAKFRKQVFEESESISRIINDAKEANKYWMKLKRNVSDPIDRITELLPRHTAKKLAEDFAIASKKIKIHWLYFVFIISTVLILTGAIIIGIWSWKDETSWNLTVLRYSIITPLIPGIFLARKLILQRNTEIVIYRHKQAVLETYIGFNDKLEDGDKSALANAVVATIVENPTKSTGFISSRNAKLRKLTLSINDGEGS